jgi:hypothetical protein
MVNTPAQFHSRLTVGKEIQLTHASSCSGRAMIAPTFYECKQPLKQLMAFLLHDIQHDLTVAI